jgi:hypothetical protein
MAITTLLDPTLLPARTMDQAAFDAAMAYLMTNLPTWGSQTNALQANLNSIAYGGAYAIPYTFKTGQAASTDPGAGKIGILTSGAQNAATAIYVDVLNNVSTDVTTLLDSMSGSTSSVLGQLRLVKQGDASKWLTFNVTSVGAPTGYRVYYVTPSGSSAASPFVDTDALILSFTRTGDKGDTGLTGPIGPAGGGFALLGSANITTAVTNIDFLSLFSDTYDNYRVDLLGILPSASDTLYLRFATGGVVDTNSVYTANFVSTSTIASSSSNTTLCNGSSVPTTGIGTTLTLDIRNARSTTRSKSYGARGQSNGTVVTGEAIYANTTAISGLRLYWGAGNTFAAGKVLVYGVKNS